MRDSVHIQDFQDTVKKHRSVTLIIDRANNLNTGVEKYPFVPSTSSILKRKEAVFTLNSILNRKVVPKSVVNPDFLEPLNCKGLFTTHAISQSPNFQSLVKTMLGRMASIRHSLNYDEMACMLPERNSGPGLIGIGLVPKLRSLSYLNSNLILTGPIVLQFKLPYLYHMVFDIKLLQTAEKPSLYNSILRFINCFKEKLTAFFSMQRNTFL
tara:strand:- start:28 stop:660 length:633 start_codon:yes stop_codon:yes gene_type:complete